MRVLVTGGTGKLGTELLPRLAAGGHDVVAFTRRPLGEASPFEFVLGDLSTGEGIEEALGGCDAVLHAATSGFGSRYTLRWAVFHPSDVDIGGTRMLLEAAQRAGIRHFVFTSIVGVDRVPGFPSIYRYFKHKLVAERLVNDATVSTTTVRLTQLYPLLDQVLRWQFGLPGPTTTLDTSGQPIDPSDAADAVVGHLGELPVNGVVEVGGPEVLTARQIVDIWTARRGIPKGARTFRPPGRLGRALREGALTCPENRVGSITWADWLAHNPAADYR